MQAYDTQLTAVELVGIDEITDPRLVRRPA
jgi:hypothetical protein